MALFTVRDDNAIHFFIGKKKEKGYYFVKTDHGQKYYKVFEKGQLLNGAGSYVFPGGKKEKSNEENEAIREFEEETGIKIGQISSNNKRQYNGGRYCVLFVYIDNKTFDKYIKKSNDYLKLSMQERKDKGLYIDDELEFVEDMTRDEAHNKFNEHRNDTGWFADALEAKEVQNFLKEKVEETEKNNI